VPADESLLAFHDRFLLRVPVAPVGDEAFAALLQLPPERAVTAVEPITGVQRQAVQSARDAVVLGRDALEALAALRDVARDLQLTVSDRRWRQFVALLRTAAATEGRAEVDALDLWLAPYVLGHDAEAVARLAVWVDVELVQAVEEPLNWLAAATEAFETQLKIEQQARADEADATAGKLALARAAGAREPEGGPLRIVSARLEQSMARRFSPLHVAAREAQVDEVREQVASALRTLEGRRSALRAQCARRLWLPPELEARWDGAHTRTIERLHAFGARLQSCRTGFSALPQDEHLPADAPARMAVDT